jgi:hypothetical protein
MHDVVWHSDSLKQVALTCKIFVEEFFLLELGEIFGLPLHKYGMQHKLISCWSFLWNDLDHNFEHRP